MGRARGVTQVKENIGFNSLPKHNFGYKYNTTYNDDSITIANGISLERIKTKQVSVSTAYPSEILRVFPQKKNDNECRELLQFTLLIEYGDRSHESTRTQA